jgi:hypothetical protein
MANPGTIRFQTVGPQLLDLFATSRQNFKSLFYRYLLQLCTEAGQVRLKVIAF